MFCLQSQYNKTKQLIRLWLRQNEFDYDNYFFSWSIIQHSRGSLQLHFPWFHKAAPKKSTGTGVLEYFPYSSQNNVAQFKESTKLLLIVVFLCSTERPAQVAIILYFPGKPHKVASKKSTGTDYICYIQKTYVSHWQNMDHLVRTHATISSPWRTKSQRQSRHHSSPPCVGVVISVFGLLETVVTSH